jgi:hypothetical protein
LFEHSSIIIIIQKEEIDKRFGLETEREYKEVNEAKRKKRKNDTSGVKKADVL